MRQRQKQIEFQQKLQQKHQDQTAITSLGDFYTPPHIVARYYVIPSEKVARPSIY